MKDYKSIMSLSSELKKAIAARDAESMMLAFDKLEKAYTSEFSDKLDGFDSALAFYEMKEASAIFFAHNNYPERTIEIFKELDRKYELIRFEQAFSTEKIRQIGDIWNRVKVLSGSLSEKHKNRTIPRNDCKCCLCRKRPANKTGSHMVPNFLAHPTFSFDGKGKRDREVLDNHFLNGMGIQYSYYGSQVTPERMAQGLGHEITEEDRESNINFLEFDNEFCSTCEDRFGVLETAYAAYYKRQQKKLSPRLSYLFWLSVIWRMNISRMGLFMPFEEEKDLQEILDTHIIGDAKAIEIDSSDLGNWKYAVIRIEGLNQNGDKGIIGSRIEHAPYVIIVNDLIVVFYPSEPSDEELTIGPIHLERSQLNDWRSQEHEVISTRRYFFDVRDWLTDSSYEYQDPAREKALLIAREQERTSGKAFSQKELDIAIRTSRIAHPELDVPHIHIRKLYRVFVADYKRKKAVETGKAYNFMEDKDIFLTEKNMHDYFEDLASTAQKGIDVTSFPFYKEAREYITNEESWKEKEQYSRSKYKQAMKSLIPQMTSKELKSVFLEKKEPLVYEDKKIGRNDPCPCGSGKKFKKCCGKNC